MEQSNPTDHEVVGFVNSISTWRNTPDGGSRVLQLFFELVQLVVSQFHLLYDSIKRGRETLRSISQYSPDWWIVVHGPADLRVFSSWPEFNGSAGVSGRPSLQIFGDFLLRLNQMDTAKLVDGLKYRLFVLTHHVELPQDHRFADLLRAFLLGMKWESYDYEYMCRLFPHARNRNTDYSVCLAVAKGFAKIQDLPDYVYSIMYCNLSETPQDISWISLKNDHYSRVFLEVCSPTCKPYRYGMNRETYEAYKVSTNPENRGNFLEAWLSFVLPQLNDWGSCIMLYVLMMRFQDGSAAVREVALNLKSSSVDGTSLETVRDPAEQDPEGLMWDSQVRHTIVNLFKEGVLVPQRSWWLRWLWRSFHGVGSAIDVRAVPSFNAAKLDVSRSQGFRRRQNAKRREARRSNRT